MMPSLALRYPIMCHQFLASLPLHHLADLEVRRACVCVWGGGRGLPLHHLRGGGRE